MSCYEHVNVTHALKSTLATSTPTSLSIHGSFIQSLESFQHTAFSSAFSPLDIYSAKCVGTLKLPSENQPSSFSHRATHLNNSGFKYLPQGLQLLWLLKLKRAYCKSFLTKVGDFNLQPLWSGTGREYAGVFFKI